MITAALAIGAIGCLVAGILLIRQEPRRILNGFLLETGVILLLFAVLSASERGTLIFTIADVLFYLMYLIIFALGLALIADFILVIRKEGKSVPHILPLAFGILAVTVSYLGFRDLTSGISGSMVYVKVMSVLYNIVLYAPYAIGAVLLYSIVYLRLPQKKAADYIIVLGCGLRKNGEVTPLLRARLDRAIQYYQKGGAQARFVVSGGQGADEVVSEAQAMQTYLLSRQIPASQILLENRSVNTRQNLLFSNDLIQENGGGTAVLCTSNYHVLRAVILARKLGIPAQGIGGHTAIYYLPVAFLREYIAVIFQYKLLILVYIIVAILTGTIFF